MSARSLGLDMLPGGTRPPEYPAARALQALCYRLVSRPTDSGQIAGADRGGDAPFAPEQSRKRKHART